MSEEVPEIPVIKPLETQNIGKQLRDALIELERKMPKDMCIEIEINNCNSLTTNE